MYILRADTGQAIEINISPGASVQSLRDTIASIVPISPQDQILLLGGKRLDQNKTLEFYGLPSKDKEVFLFNRRAIADPNFPIEESAPSTIETQVPPVRPLSKEYESKPLIQALKTFEHQFSIHFATAQAICEAYERRLYICKMSFSEAHVQVRAIDCAIMNLNDHMAQLVHTHTDFIAHAKLQCMESDEILDGFDEDLAKLKEVQLHTAHATQGTTLLDCVPEARLKSWAKDGRTDNDHVKVRIPDMESQLRGLQTDVDNENKKPIPVDFDDLGKRVAHGDAVYSDIVTKVQMFAKDYENVRGRLEMALRNMHNQSVGSFCDGFDEIAKVHESHLAFLRAQDEASKDTYNIFIRAKEKISRSVYTRIRAVSQYQSRVRELHNTMAVMQEALSRLKAAFAQLAIVKNMPRAYQAAIQEVARRRGFSKRIRREVLRMNSSMAQIRDEEIPKREHFLSKYFYFVPKDLLPGLQDPLPILEVSIPTFDVNLPPIDSASATNDDDDFTLVPFSGDDPMPRMQSFDRENAFSQSGSNNYNLTNHNNNNPPNTYTNPNIPASTTPPYSYTPPASISPSTTPSNPIPITSTKGFAPAVHTSGGSLSVSPSQSTDVVKLQKELNASKAAAASYAERINHLENELNKLYREKVELTQQKMENATIGGSKAQSMDSAMRLIAERDDTIRQLRAEIDTLKDRDQFEPAEPTTLSESEVASLQAKVFEQEHQIERLMAAITSSREPLVVSSRQPTSSDGEVKRLTDELDELKRKEKQWEEEKKEANEKYEGMMKQLTDELNNLREEKLHTSRRWDNGKVELEKTQKMLDTLKAESAQEKEESSTAIQKLQQVVKQQAEQWEREKETWETQKRETDQAMAKSIEEWDSERESLRKDAQRLEDVVREKAALETSLRAELQAAQQAAKNLQADIDSLSKNAADLRADLEVAAAKLAKEGEAVVKLRGENDDLRDTIAGLENAFAQKDTFAKSSVEQFQAAQKKADELQARCEELKVTCETVNNSLSALKVEKKQADEACDQLKQTVADRESKLSSVQAALDEMRNALKVAGERAEVLAKETAAALKAKEDQLSAIDSDARSKAEQLLEISSFLNTNDEQLREKDEALAAKEVQLREKIELLTVKDAQLREKDEVLAAKDVQLRELVTVKDAQLREKDELLATKDVQLRELVTVKDAQLREKDDALRAKAERVREVEASLASKEEELRTKDEALAQGEEMSRSVANLSQLLETKEKGFSDEVLDYERKLMMMEERQKQEEMDRYRMFELEREEMVTAHNARISQLQQQITDLQKQFLKQEDGGAQLVALKNDSAEQKATIAELQSRLKDQGVLHQQELDALVQKYTKKEAEINEISVQIQKKNSVLEKRIQDIEEDKRRIQQQLDQVIPLHSRAEGDFKQMNQVINEISENLKKHPACRNLQENDSADVFAKFQLRINTVLAHIHALEEERDHLSVQLVTETSQLRSLVQAKDNRLDEVERKLQDAQGHLSALEMSMHENVPNKISFEKFKDGDIVLFLPKGKSHEAFNINTPNYYLAEVCKPVYENQTYICGQIIEINTRKATARDNPFNVPEGTDFHEVTITPF